MPIFPVKKMICHDCGVEPPHKGSCPRLEFKPLLADAPEGVELLRFQCRSCGNRCLTHYVPNETCVCGSPDWVLCRNQESYLVNGDDWIHPRGI